MNKTSILSCNQLLNIFSASHIATAIYTSDDLIIEAATQAMIVFWGKDRSVIGKPFSEAIPELVGQQFIDELRSVLKTGKTVGGEGVPAHIKINGELKTRYYDYEYRAISDDEGQIICVLHTAFDVTEKILGLEAIEYEKQKTLILEREQALNEELVSANEELNSTNEELFVAQISLQKLNNELEERVNIRTKELAKRESQLRFMIDDAPVAIAVLKGRDLIIESANQNILGLWGRSNSIFGQKFTDAFPELLPTPFVKILDNVFTSGIEYVGKEVKAVINIDKREKGLYTNFIFKPLKDDHGVTHSLMIVANDVTEQVLGRKAIEEGRYKLQAMVTTTPVAMAILKGRTPVIDLANDAMLYIWQRGKEEVMNKELFDIFPELRNQVFPGLLEQVFDSGKSISMPEVLVKIGRSGRIDNIYVNFSYDPLYNEEGKVESILATVVDITESVNTRKLLEESEEELQATTEELISTNEELISINEEMTAANEELMSTNDELICTKDHLNETLSQLKESESRFRFLLNAIPQQVWTAQPDGILDYVNDVVSKDFGFNSEEIIGYGWQKFIHPDDLPQALQRWLSALSSGQEYLVEFRLLFADGNYRWHLGRAVPLKENDEVVLWLGTNTDIDLQKNNEQKKDEFLSIASHELKTPLTSIKAFNQLMNRTLDTDKVKSFIGKSADHISRLERLISDLLDVTKINAGKLEYNMQPFNFKQLLIDSIENVKHISPNHEVVLQNAVDFTIVGDHFRLEQVMNNFLTNAVKYSPNGKTVLVNSKIEDNHVMVSVKDFGIGIAPSHIEKLFDRYYRVDNTSMRFEGLGLGLFISSEIVIRHHGTCWIESEQDKGSTFYFKIPLSQKIVSFSGIN